MLHKEIPFLRIGIPLCAGIVTGLYFKPAVILILPASALIAAGFLASLFYNNRLTNHLYGYTLTFSLFVAGHILYRNEKDSISILKQEESLFIATLSDYPLLKEKSRRLTVKLNRRITRHGSESVKGSIILYQRRENEESSFMPGDVLIIKCSPVEIESRGNPFEFDYRFFMENQGIKYYAYITGKDLISHSAPDRRKLIHRALILREKIIGMYEQRGITGERLALVAAITLGQKNMLDPDQKNSFIKAGIMHIMAVSGLHAVILSLFVFNILFFLKRKFNIVRISVTMVILWSFAFVTGLTPSVLRATLMFSFLQAGNIMKREVNGINSVLASAFVLILIKPSVIFDAGFLLSYSAVIYIIVFYRDLYQKLQFRNVIIDKIWQSAAVTIVAQAGTLPLTVMLFNRFPTYFIITNVIIVPLSSLLIVIGCMIPMLFPVRILSQPLAFLLNNLTGLTELLTRKASLLPYASIENIGMTTVECLLLAVALFLLSWYILNRQSFKPVYPIIFFIIFQLAATAREISTRTTNELIVYNTAGSSAIGVRTGKILNLYSDTTVADAAVLRHCSTLGLKIKSNTIKNNYCCLRAGGKNIMITNSPERVAINSFIPDILVFTGSESGFKNNPQLKLSPETLIIFTRIVPRKGSLKPEQYFDADSVYYVRKSGAFTEKI